MSTSKKLILGILTILPLLLMSFYFIFFFSFIFSIATGHIAEPELNGDRFPVELLAILPMFIMIFISGIIALALMIYYLIHISKNKKFDSTQRLLWILIIIFTNTIGQIVYFIMEIWPEKPEEQLDRTSGEA